jgi:hypothetical protein
MSRRGVVALAAVFVLSIALDGARADAPFAQAWWWAPNDSALPATPPAVPTVTVPLAPPDVPEDALYLATNLTGMEAMAALLYVIPEGATATALTLEVAGTPVGDPRIQLCPTISAWAQARAGAWGSRPQYQCAPDAPIGALSDDGLSMTWVLGALGESQAIDLALVPVLSEDVTQSTSRITFSKPGASSLAVTRPEVVEDTFSVAPFEPSDQGPRFDSVDVIAASGSVFIAGFEAIPPSAPTPAIVEGAAPRTNFENPAPRTGGLAANAARPTARDNMQTLGMFGLILLAAMYARFSGQPQRAPRSLVRFATDGGTGESEAR